MHFFVHIPKTAGTSFRTAAERYFGADRVAYDYGRDSPVTSLSVQQFLYRSENEDKTGLSRRWQETGVALVAGHMPVVRFADGTGLARVLTFVREPLERTFSEYLHVRRKKEFEGSCRDFFLERPSDHQSRMFSKIPLQALGFVGITERYSESLRLLNQQFGWNIRKRRVNRAGLFDPGPNSISKADRAAFYERNPLDVALYEEACWFFEQRLALLRQGRPFAHAAVEKSGGGTFRGFAFWSNGSDKPVTIDLRRNGLLVKQVLADRRHEFLARHGAPRAGQVAFAASLEVKPGDEISCVVADTGQPLTRVRGS